MLSFSRTFKNTLHKFIIVSFSEQSSGTDTLVGYEATSSFLFLNGLWDPVFLFVMKMVYES